MFEFRCGTLYVLLGFLWGGPLSRFQWSWTAAAKQLLRLRDVLSKISLQKGVEHAEWGTKDRNIASNWSQENVVNTYGTSCLMQFDKNRGEREGDRANNFHGDFAVEYWINMDKL